MESKFPMMSVVFEKLYVYVLCFHVIRCLVSLFYVKIFLLDKYKQVIVIYIQTKGPSQIRLDLL